MLHINNLQLWNATNPHYACAELVVQYQGVYYDPISSLQISHVTIPMSYNPL